MAQTSYTATATGIIAGPVDAGSGKTHRQFGLKVLSTAPDCVVALETSPDGTTFTEQCRSVGPRWSYGRSDLAVREAHVNVISLGTGAPPLAAVITYY